MRDKFPRLGTLTQGVLFSAEYGSRMESVTTGEEAVPPSAQPHWFSHPLRAATSAAPTSVFLRASGAVVATFSGAQFIDLFKLFSLPPGGMGVMLFTLAAACLFLTVELCIVHSRAPQHNVSASAPEISPEEALAAGILNYAKALASSSPPRDSAILELRARASRLLHLCGQSGVRQKLGELAFGAAAAAKDKVLQASILLDDRGWAVFDGGDARTALENIREAVQLLDDHTSSEPSDHEALELRAKALRHIANIEASTAGTLTEARALFVEPRIAAEILPEPRRQLSLAQVDHSEARVMLDSLEKEIGAHGTVDVRGPSATTLAEALRLVCHAEDAFRNLGDLEREAKAMKTRVRLLAHDHKRTRYEAALGQLSRIERQVSRRLTT